MLAVERVQERGRGAQWFMVVSVQLPYVVLLVYSRRAVLCKDSERLLHRPALAHEEVHDHVTCRSGSLVVSHAAPAKQGASGYKLQVKPAKPHPLLDLSEFYPA